MDDETVVRGCAQNQDAHIFFVAGYAIAAASKVKCQRSKALSGNTFKVASRQKIRKTIAADVIPAAVRRT